MFPFNIEILDSFLTCTHLSPASVMLHRTEYTPVILASWEAKVEGS